MGRTGTHDRAQASVELALVLPLVVLLLLALIQAGLVVRDQLLVAHAAREAVRAAALDDDTDAIERAATEAGPLDADHVDVRVSGREGPGSQVTVEVVYDAPARVPLVGPIVGDIQLRASASMRVER